MALYQVVVKQTWRANECVNVHHYETTNVLDATQKQELADAMRVAYSNLDFGSQMDNAWSVDSAVIRFVGQPDQPGEVLPFTSGPYAGSATAVNTLPNQVAPYISWYAPTQTPRRGRTYLAGVHSSVIGDNGLVVAGFITRMDAFANLVLSVTLTGDTAAKIAVLYNPDSPSMVQLYHGYTRFVSRGNPGVQRRRRLGTGV